MLLANLRPPRLAQRRQVTSERTRLRIGARGAGFVSAEAAEFGGKFAESRVDCVYRRQFFHPTPTGLNTPIPVSLPKTSPASRWNAIPNGRGGFRLLLCFGDGTQSVILWRVSKRQTVLIVEDDLPLRYCFRMALTLAGFDVREAGDGLQALQIVDADPPDAIVLDLGLPRMHGRAVHEELRRHTNTRSIPVIIVTGSVQPAAEGEAACVLTKPVSSDELVEVVQKCLAADGGSQAIQR